MKRFDVTWLGKAGTFALMFAFPLFLLAAAPTSRARACSAALAWIFGIPGLVLSYYAAFTYIPHLRAPALRRGTGEARR